MNGYLKKLRLRHRRIDRLIDTSKAAGKQEEVKILKRMRLQLKARIAAAQARGEPAVQWPRIGGAGGPTPSCDPGAVT